MKPEVQLQLEEARALRERIHPFVEGEALRRLAQLQASPHPVVREYVHSILYPGDEPISLVEKLQLGEIDFAPKKAP